MEKQAAAIDNRLPVFSSAAKSSRNIFVVLFMSSIYVPTPHLSSTLFQIVKRILSLFQIVLYTHEPLITKELWELVREVRRHKRRAPKKFEDPNLFSGLLYCADCGAPLRLFIDKIVIGERSVKYSRCAAQEVSIYYRDVGLLDTAEELDMENLLSDTAASA